MPCLILLEKVNISVGIFEDSVGYSPWVLAVHYICLSEYLWSFPSWLIKFSFHLTTFFGQCLVGSTVKCKLIHLGLKLKTRTDSYDFLRKMRTHELPLRHGCGAATFWSQSGLSHCGKPVKLYHPFFFHLWLPDTQSFQQFSLGGYSVFSRETAGAWQHTNLWGPVGKSLCVMKALSTGLCCFKQWCYDCPTRSLESAVLARSPHQNLIVVFATFKAVLCSFFLSCWLAFTWLLHILLAKILCI